MHMGGSLVASSALALAASTALACCPTSMPGLACNQTPQIDASQREQEIAPDYCEPTGSVSPSFSSCCLNSDVRVSLGAASMRRLASSIRPNLRFAQMTYLVMPAS